MTDFQPGDRIDVTIYSAEVVSMHADGWMRLNFGRDSICVDYPQPGVTVTPHRDGTDLESELAEAAAEARAFIADYLSELGREI